MPWFHRVSQGTADEPSLRAMALLLGLRLREPHLRSFRSLALCKSLVSVNQYYFQGLNTWTLPSIEWFFIWKIVSRLNFFEPIERIDRSLNQLNSWTHWTFWTLEPFELLNFLEPFEPFERSFEHCPASPRPVRRGGYNRWSGHFLLRRTSGQLPNINSRSPVSCGWSADAQTPTQY